METIGILSLSQSEVLKLDIVELIIFSENFQQKKKKLSKICTWQDVFTSSSYEVSKVSTV